LYCDALEKRSKQRANCKREQKKRKEKEWKKRAETWKSKRHRRKKV